MVIILIFGRASKPLNFPSEERNTVVFGSINEATFGNLRDGGCLPGGGNIVIKESELSVSLL